MSRPPRLGSDEWAAKHARMIDGMHERRRRIAREDRRDWWITWGVIVLAVIALLAFAPGGGPSEPEPEDPIVDVRP